MPTANPNAGHTPYVVNQYVHRWSIDTEWCPTSADAYPTSVTYILGVFDLEPAGLLLLSLWPAFSLLHLLQSLLAGTLVFPYLNSS